LLRNPPTSRIEITFRVLIKKSISIYFSRVFVAARSEKKLKKNLSTVEEERIEGEKAARTWKSIFIATSPTTTQQKPKSEFARFLFMNFLLLVALAIGAC
jgi:uncharacterized membrane protein YcjF (UPF0283 family)